MDAGSHAHDHVAIQRNREMMPRIGEKLGAQRGVYNEVEYIIGDAPEHR